MGGKAFPNTESILLEEIDPTLKMLAMVTEQCGLDWKYLRNNMLGSAGKKPVSGDIDINVDETKFDLDLISELLINAYGAENVMVRKGNNQIFTSIPVYMIDDLSYGVNPRIHQHLLEHRVQVDFMFGNHAWQAFSYFSPPTFEDKSRRWFKQTSKENRSDYKGLYRTELIKALVAFSSDWTLEENGEMIARVGPTFFHDRGLIWRYRYRPFKRGSTTERVKAFKEVSKDEFFTLFPSAFEASHESMIDPKEVCNFLIEGSNPTLFETYELLADTLFIYEGKSLRKIHKIYLERLNSLKVAIPEEIKRGHHFGFGK